MVDKERRRHSVSGVGAQVKVNAWTGRKTVTDGREVEFGLNAMRVGVRDAKIAARRGTFMLRVTGMEPTGPVLIFCYFSIA